MNPFQSTRKALGLTQTEMASAIGVTQGSVSFYENGKTVPPEVAKRLIVYAAERGHVVTLDELYGLRAASEPAQAGA